jgi:hypothetical protein
VSLILDALKKLERDKETGEPGVIVVGAVPWEGVRRRRTPALALTLVVLLVLVGISAGAWWLARAQRRAPAEGRASGGAAAPTATAMPTASDAAPAASTVPSAPATGTGPTRSAPLARRLTLPDRATDAASTASEHREAAPPSRVGPQLNAISQQDGRPVAVIDGRLVREGDSVDGVRILRIGETEVEVEVGGRRRTLRF